MSNENNMGCDMVGLLDIKGQDQCRRVYSVDGIAPTLTTSGGGQRQVKIFDTRRLRVRKLTPKEYGILQAFPMENWKQVVSDSQAYKQFGNAVTTTVFTSIAEEIKKAILQNESEEINMEANKKAAEDGLENAMNAPITENEPETVEATTPTVEAAEREAVPAAVETTPEELPDFITPADLAADITNAIFEKTYLPGFCFEAANDCIFRLIMEKAEGRYIFTDKQEIKRDWEAAENAVNDILSKYAPGGYMGKVIYPVLTPLKERLESGERTADLFNAIVEATR